MDDVVDLLERAAQPSLVAHVADEESELGVVIDPCLFAERGEFVAHDELLVLVARVDDDLLGIVVLQHVAGERVAERAGASGYEDGFVIEHVQFLSMLLFSRCVQCKTRRDASHWWQCLETADISQIHMFFLAYAHSRGRSNPIERTCPLDLRQSLKLVFTSLEDRPFLLSRERWGSKMEILQTACIFAYCQTLRIGTSLRWPFFGPILPLFGVGGDLPSTAASPFATCECVVWNSKFFGC